ncbi:hypothetical protein C8R44DRAFT_730180 [Mycena epipterygia]|nr:hypothetical protein C8R44DRAFT_730180 [Mycena epipterygia]
MSPRFLWFFLGAGVGAWWATNKKINVDCQIHRTLAPPMSSQPSQQMAPPNGSEPRPEMLDHQTLSDIWDRERVRVRQTTYNHSDVWDQERERVRQFSQSAGDTVAELSEATLNTIMQATEALKAKMAEHRALREEERRMEEERRRNPPRYV